MLIAGVAFLYGNQLKQEKTHAQSKRCLMLVKSVKKKKKLAWTIDTHLILFYNKK